MLNNLYCTQLKTAIVLVSSPTTRFFVNFDNLGRRNKYYFGRSILMQLTLKLNPGFVVVELMTQLVNPNRFRSRLSPIVLFSINFGDPFLQVPWQLAVTSKPSQ